MRADQRNSLRLNATPANAGRNQCPTRVPTTSWIMMPISSYASIRPRSARYSIGSGPNVDA